MRSVVYKASKVVQKYFIMVQKSSKGTGLLQKIIGTQHWISYFQAYIM